MPSLPLAIGPAGGAAELFSLASHRFCQGELGSHLPFQAATVLPTGKPAPHGAKVELETGPRYGQLTLPRLKSGDSYTVHTRTHKGAVKMPLHSSLEQSAKVLLTLLSNAPTLCAGRVFHRSRCLLRPPTRWREGIATQVAYGLFRPALKCGATKLSPCVVDSLEPPQLRAMA